MAVELVVLTPALVACILAVAAGARYEDARGQTSTAAYAAARAASLTTNHDAAVEAGRRAAARSLADRGPGCATLMVVINAGEFHAGGSIRATVTCIADLADLTGLGLPGHKAFTATATVPLEQHRDFS
jgi:Flp pilus assembly protein TadG